MPIYEFACPKCRRIYSFLSRRINAKQTPVCPGCGNKQLERQLSSFAAPRGAKEPNASGLMGGDGPVPDFNDPKLARAMGEFEKELTSLDANDPRQVARLVRRMKDALPRGAMPKEMEAALKRLEAGESVERIEEDMGDVLDKFIGDEGNEQPRGGARRGAGGYVRDSGLYDF